MKQKKGNNFDYQLLDSGQGKKLEQVGEYRLIRPSSLAIWQPAQPKLWSSANTEYVHQKGWSRSLADWRVSINQKQQINCRLQDNGQIGLFPEHQQYLSELTNFLTPKDQVLNLFAYTGLASVTLAPQCQSLTHLDLSKRCLSWAKENLELNKIDNVRIIAEDALNFLAKEVKRERKYQLIILDPPSFSRVSKTKTWDLNEELIEFCKLTTQLLDQKHGLICFTSHLQANSIDTIHNLFWDLIGNQARYSSKLLRLADSFSGRSIPCSGLNLIYV